MPTPRRIQRNGLPASEAAMWVRVQAELKKSTPLGLVTAFVIVERWIEENRLIAMPLEILRVVDRFEELISE